MSNKQYYKKFKSWKESFNEKSLLYFICEIEQALSEFKLFNGRGSFQEVLYLLERLTCLTHSIRVTLS